MRFDLTDLRLFLAVAEAGSITLGAEAANLSLAAASERVREMEASSGVPLLTRERRGAVPNRAGEALAHHARRVLREVAALQAELAEHARGVRASIRVLGNTASITEFLPERLGPWLEAHPQIDVDLAERPSAEIVRAVVSGIAALGIVSDAVDTATLAVRPFALDRLVAVLPRGHRLAAAERLAFRQLLDEPRIAGIGALQQHLDEQARRLGHPRGPRVALRTFEGVCRVVSSGAGVGVVPETAVRRLRRTLPIAAVPLSDRWATRRLVVCCADPATAAPPARALFEHLGASG